MLTMIQIDISVKDVIDERERGEVVVLELCLDTGIQNVITRTTVPQVQVYVRRQMDVIALYQ